MSQNMFVYSKRLIHLECFFCIFEYLAFSIGYYGDLI